MTTPTQAPCHICGYNGPGFYQPETHKCMETILEGTREGFDLFRKSERNATIERCAQVAEGCTANGEAIAKGIAAAIRALKDKA